MLGYKGLKIQVCFVSNFLETCLLVSILPIYIVLFILILFFGLFFFKLMKQANFMRAILYLR